MGGAVGGGWELGWPVGGLVFGANGDS